MPFFPLLPRDPPKCIEMPRQPGFPPLKKNLFLGTLKKRSMYLAYPTVLFVPFPFQRTRKTPPCSLFEKNRDP